MFSLCRIVHFLCRFGHSHGHLGAITSDLVLVTVGASTARPAIYFQSRSGDLLDPESMVEVGEDLLVRGDRNLTVRAPMARPGELTISTHGRGEIVTGSVQSSYRPRNGGFQPPIGRATFLSPSRAAVAHQATGVPTAIPTAEGTKRPNPGNPPVADPGSPGGNTPTPLRQNPFESATTVPRSNSQHFPSLLFLLLRYGMERVRKTSLWRPRQEARPLPSVIPVPDGPKLQRLTEPTPLQQRALELVKAFSGTTRAAS